MVKLFQNDITYQYPWSTTTIGFWSKYPNPHSTHVLSIDTLSRSVDEETGILRTERIIKARQGVPMLGVSEDAWVREIVWVDPIAKITSTVSINMSLSEYVQCIELISYARDPTSPPGTSSTLFTQRAHISSPPSGLPPYAPSTGPGHPLSKSMSRILRKVGAKLESSSVERFGMNAGTGKTGFEGVLQGVQERLDAEGQVFEREVGDGA
ncbi:hypothetical protein QFC22_002450 [Naganishia vaughanmartiniae]|uniref:Uncharacterized protein n=1 Tax=Naganishia vaughanmartiniae TaxID=1424756 RepID=A0ACC2XEY1_9TREE|nr:hypothetical protein QFC22_002450 [Naganishia vaughanmartiniae]